MWGGGGRRNKWRCEGVCCRKLGRMDITDSEDACSAAQNWSLGSILPLGDVLLFKDVSFAPRRRIKTIFVAIKT